MILILGPCVIESEDHALRMASQIKRIARGHGFDFVFKASFDKANRTSLSSYRGPGLEAGLRALQKVKEEVGCPVTTDIHEPSQAGPVAEVADIIQIPALLSRQTDLIVAAARTGRIVNIKKGQFAAPLDMTYAVDKALGAGAQEVWLTERGTTFGYHNLVVDMRSFALMQSLGVPVIFDASHSTQFPGGAEGVSDGQRTMIHPLARAAVAAGADGVFCEVHDDPDNALCDGPNSLPLGELPGLLATLKAIRAVVS